MIFIGAYFMVLESRLATLQIREEIQHLHGKKGEYNVNELQ